MPIEAIPRLTRSRVPRQSAGDAFVTSLAAGLDRSLMRAVSLIVERQILPRDVDLDALRDSIDVMLASGLTEYPGEFFDFIPALERPGKVPRSRGRAAMGRRPEGGRLFRRSLPSRYREHPRFPARPDPHEDDNILFEHWVHRDAPPRGTVIVLHGFAMGWPLIDGFALSARQWFERGLDVVLLTLPDHGARRAPGKVFSGQRYTVPHAVHLAGAVHQAVHEIFEVKSWLRARGDAPVGLFGMSLGGYLASLCAGLSEDFDFIVPMVPPACMGDLAWRVYSSTSHHRMGPDPVLTEENMRAAFRLHSPLAHARRVPRERILLIAGAGDRVVPPEHPTALWEHWEKPDIHWFRGSHVSPVMGARLAGLLDRHLTGLGILAA